MRAILAAGLLAMTACVSVVPVSVTTLPRVQLREQAGMYPPEWIVEGDSHAAQLATLTAWSEHNEIIVTTAKLDSRHLRGSAQYGYHGWVVLLDDTLSPNAKLWTLVHELTHIYGPRAPVEEDREVIAELTAAMVCERLGLNVWPQSTSYLASRAPDLERQTATVQRYGWKIDALVDGLVKATQAGPR